MTEEVKRWWEATAASFQSAIDLPVGINWAGFGTADLDLLTDVAGADVVELGCGGGQCTVELARRGADVVGVDLSAAQLAHARDLAAEHGVDVDLLEADLTALPLTDGRFDVAFNAWVFQWVGDLAAAFAEAHRVLRPGGRLVFATPHAVYGLADAETHEVTESYFDTGRHVIRVDDRDPDQVVYRHRVSDVVNAVVDAGFRVERLLEPGSDDPDDYDPGPWGEMTPELMAKLPTTLVVDASRE
ncbi:MAG: class I SAM-dependent methyltransferase [Haloarculaceae archaeon]